jgi:drug/metabolite transporter superfamily protein YnfA
MSAKKGRGRSPEDLASAPTLDVASAPTLDAASAPTLDVASAPTLDVASAPTLDAASAPTLDVASAPTLAAASESDLHAAAAPPARPGVGATLDHYELIDELGAGGMGLVYLARDKRLGRPVALKLIRPELLHSGGLASLLDEARATACFNHPHIITIHDVSLADAVPYIAFEHIEGRTLRQHLSARGGPATDALDVIEHALAIASALAQAHRHGIAHGDLKPDNVMLPVEGPLRVLDFGLAAATDRGDAELGSIRGTPAYLAPEQWQGQRASAASDVWSFGMLLHELLFGELPFRATSLPEIEAQVRAGRETWPRPRRARRQLMPLVKLAQRCLDPDPSQRLSAAQLLARLEALGADERRRRRPMGAAASALLVLFGGLLSEGVAIVIALLFYEWTDSQMSVSGILGLLLFLVLPFVGGSLLCWVGLRRGRNTVFLFVFGGVMALLNLLLVAASLPASPQGDSRVMAASGGCYGLLLAGLMIAFGVRNIRRQRLRAD